MTTLVTGIAGFIGAHIAAALCEAGDEVIGIDNFKDYYNPQYKQQRYSALVPPHATLYNDDITDEAFIDTVFQQHNINRVCHLAAQAGVRYSIEQPQVYIKNNISGTQAVINSMIKHDVAHLVYASSSSVYGGITTTPFSETMSVDQPVSVYAATKKMNELQAHVAHHQYQLNCTGLRFFTVYGPWGRPDMAPYKFIDRIARGESIDVYNNGQHQRDFTYIDDVVSGVLAALNQCKGYQIYNLGNDQPVALEDFISTIEKHTKKIADKQYLPKQVGDVEVTWADITKARNNLNYNPEVTIDQGIAQTVAWYQEYAQA